MVGLVNPQGKPMTEITRVGIDLAKRVIPVHAINATGRVVVSKALPADKFAAWCVRKLLQK